MPTCKDCVHYDLCADFNLTARADYKRSMQIVEDDGKPERCGFFKDRSKFVDVSELQQNVIRPLTNRCAEYTKCQMCLACVLKIRERCEHYEKAEQALKEQSDD